MAKISIQPEGVATPDVPLSLGIRKGNIVQVAGQIGRDLVTGERPGTVGEQTRQVLRNIETVLATAGATLDDVIMLRVYLTDLAHAAEMNEAYAELVPKPFPARTTVYVGLPPGILVEIDALAVLE
jgi:2-iminobutanoate/2-iminopropanoate deaminase